MKFSIRDLLLVMVIVALCVAWWVDHRRQASEIKKWRYKDMEREAAKWGLAPPRRELPSPEAPTSDSPNNSAATNPDP